ncbi:unnamed protein product, partial [Prunus brigantina]
PGWLAWLRGNDGRGRFTVGDYLEASIFRGVVFLPPCEFILSHLLRLFGHLSSCASSFFSSHGFSSNGFLGFVKKKKLSLACFYREEDLRKKNWSNQYENPQSAHQSAFLNLTLPGQHPNPEVVVQEVHRKVYASLARRQMLQGTQKY